MKMGQEPAGQAEAGAASKRKNHIRVARITEDNGCNDKPDQDSHDVPH